MLDGPSSTLVRRMIYPIPLVRTFRIRHSAHGPRAKTYTLCRSAAVGALATWGPRTIVDSAHVFKDSYEHNIARSRSRPHLVSSANTRPSLPPGQYIQVGILEQNKVRHKIYTRDVERAVLLLSRDPHRYRLEVTTKPDWRAAQTYRRKVEKRKRMQAAMDLAMFTTSTGPTNASATEPTSNYHHHSPTAVPNHPISTPPTPTPIEDDETAE